MGKMSGIEDLSSELAAEMGISKAESRRIMHKVVKVFGSAIVKGGISLRGMMVIKPKLKKGRTGVIQFGEDKGKEYKSKDKLVLSIKTGADMDAELNGQ